MLAQALGQAPGALERRLGRVVAAGRRQQRVDAVVHVLGERARVLAADQRHDVARTVGRQLGAEDDGAARQVTAQPAGAAHDLARLEVRARAKVLEERAAQVLLDLLLGLLDRHLGQRRDGGEVQVLGGLRRSACRGPPSRTTAPTTSSPDAIGTSMHEARRDLRRPVLDAVGDVAAQLRRATSSAAASGCRRRRAPRGAG